MDSEKWVDIKGYEGSYQISNDGKVKSFKRNKPFILKNTNHSGGYLDVGLSKKGKVKRFYLHRLVAKHFLYKKQGATEVNHKNGMKKDNRMQNLEWVTSSENTRHARKSGLFKEADKGRRGELHFSAKLTNEEALEIRRIGTSRPAKELSEEYGVSLTAIYNIRNGRGWKHI